MFRKAASILSCPKDCDSSCPNCVLDFDQRFEASALDRKAALRILNSKWLNLLTLPAELQYFGESSQVESSPLATAVVRESGEPDTKATRLYGSGDPSKWDFAGSTLRQVAYKLLSLSRPVEVVIPQELIGKLSEEDRYSLAALADHPNVTVRTTDKLPLSKGAAVVAEVERVNGSLGWASADSNALLGSGAWGQTLGPLIRGVTEIGKLGQALVPSLIRPTPVDNGDKEIIFQHQLDGPIKTFGDRLWKLVRQHHPATDKVLGNITAKVVLVTYIDRYLFTPLSVALVGQLLAGLREAVGTERFGHPEVTITTTAVRQDGQKFMGGKVFADWPTTQMRDTVAGLVFEPFGKVKINTSDRAVQHARTLEIVFSTGEELAVRLDQGVSYWRAAAWSKAGANSSWFDFANPIATTQANAIRAMDVWIEGQTLPTLVFAKARTIRSVNGPNASN